MSRRNSKARKGGRPVPRSRELPYWTPAELDEPELVPQRPADPLHGYSLTDIHRMTIGAIRCARSTSLDLSERYDLAWHTIAEMLCSTAEKPAWGSLVGSAAHQIDELTNDHYHTWGRDRNTGYGFGAMGGFQKFWFLLARPSQFEDGLVDRLALAQIWPRLTRPDQEVLLAMAVHGDHGAAARALGKLRRTFTDDLNDARRAFRLLWHEHETPSHMWGRSAPRGRHTTTQVLHAREYQRRRRAALAET